jgi:hypothetical protein
MNDYWNDPPEQPELPECCDEIMDVDEKGACVCSKCGKRIEPPAEIDPSAFADVELPNNYLRESANSDSETQSRISKSANL